MEVGGVVTTYHDILAGEEKGIVGSTIRECNLHSGFAVVANDVKVAFDASIKNAQAITERSQNRIATFNE